MRLNLDFLEKIQSAMPDWSIEIGNDDHGLTLRFGYWKKITDIEVDVINKCLPNHLKLELNLVDEDEECGGELWNYNIVKNNY